MPGVRAPVRARVAAGSGGVSRIVDLLIVGGGINGAAIARDAAGRGIATYLAEQRDYASGTSSASSKLIHGGLRYLEHGEFRLVRQSLREREVLMRLAPHLVRPLRFLVPITRGQPKPAWMVRTGLWLYDRLAARRALAPSGRLRAAEADAVPHLRRQGLRAVLHYPDCWSDDARLTLACLLDARDRGADIGNYREVVRIRPESDAFTVTVRESGHPTKLRARHLINAAGPWVHQVLDLVAAETVQRRNLRLVRGSHIVIRAPDPGPEPGQGPRPGLRDAFTLVNDDGRVVFVLPWLERHLIVGTTDVPHEGPLEDVRCAEIERDYLLDCYRRFFDHPVTPADIVWSFAGVRPLVDDGAADPSNVSRAHALDIQSFGRATLTTVHGGKLTSHRLLAEAVCAELGKHGLAVAGPWTAKAPLHGGDLDRAELAALAHDGPEAIATSTRKRWAFTYGSRTADLYERITADPALAKEVVAGVPAVELDHALKIEDARHAEDFLYRRTKLFIDLDDAAREQLARWFRVRSDHASQARGWA